MKILTTTLKSLTILVAAAGLAYAQTPSAKTDTTTKSASSPAAAAAMTPATATTSTSAAEPNEAEMMKMMMEMGKLNENHKMLAEMNGTWNFVTKFWMNGDPTSKPQESKGTAVRKSLMGGRYFQMDVKGKMQMPDEKGKMKEMDFTGMAVEGYDNASQKFVSSWIDSMGTGIMMTSGTYDAATKTLTSTGEFQMAPNMKMKVREVLKITDKDHMNFEWYEERGGKEVKTMEIAYTRAGKK